MTMLHDRTFETLLDELHGRSKSEEPETFAYFGERFRAGTPIDMGAGQDRQFMAGKLVALDREKAEFCYSVCRALDARRAVEAGTSFGVSALWLAAALRDNFKSG